MAREERIIYVYDDFSCDEPVLLGKLYVGVIKQGETYSLVRTFPFDQLMMNTANTGGSFGGAARKDGRVFRKSES